MDREVEKRQLLDMEELKKHSGQVIIIGSDTWKTGKVPKTGILTFKKSTGKSTRNQTS